MVVVIGAFLLRTDSKIANPPHPYAANLKLSDLKMSAAENFIGTTVTYLDGTVTNAGDKTVSHAVVHVTFKDSLGQVAQAEDVPSARSSDHRPLCRRSRSEHLAAGCPARASRSASPSSTSPPTGITSIPRCRVTDVSVK